MLSVGQERTTWLEQWEGRFVFSPDWSLAVCIITVKTGRILWVIDAGERSMETPEDILPKEWLRCWDGAGLFMLHYLLYLTKLCGIWFGAMFHSLKAGIDNTISSF